MKTVSKLTVVPPTRPSPLAALVDDYLADRRARGASPKTIRYGYGFPLREIFLPWAADNDIDSIDKLTSRELNRYSAHLQDHGGKSGAPLKPSTVWTYSKVVRGLLSWAKEEGEKVSGEIKLPKLPRVMVETLSPDEINRLENGAAAERDKIIVRLLSDTGMRRNELVHLTTRDLLEEGGQFYLLVHGKGSRDRKVPVTPRMARRLRKLIASRPADVDSKRIFLGLKRRPGGSLEPLTDSGVTQLVSALGERVLGKRVWPHMIRHSAATTMLRRGVDSLLVAQVLGHSGLQMLQKTYSHLQPADAAAALMAVLRQAED